MNFLTKRHYSSFQIIIFGFLLVITLGTLLLMLPAASRTPGSAGFQDALFTATSAVCVTGLVVQDTATYWSPFGQSIILLLIQIGGLGVITVAVAITAFSGKKIGLIQRNTLQSAISAHHVGGIVRLLSFTLKITFLVEGIGALLLSISFVPEFGFGKGLWYGFFHSISAFCNAGFDLMGERSHFSSLTSFASSPLINLVIPALIIFGGIGFLTWEDLVTNRFHIRKYRMQTKAILLMTVLLITIPFLYFYFFEFSSCSGAEHLLVSFFQSVTPRTAGFNTADLTELSDTGILMTIFLMLTGGSPGSTAGGIKTTTVIVLAASAFAVFRRNETAKLFHRGISTETVHQAAAIFHMYLVLFLTTGMIISRIENLPILTCLFETASAIGTVGLTLGITPHLSAVSRILLILLMFFGRVGGLTLIFAAIPNNKNKAKLPQEIITVG